MSPAASNSPSPRLGSPVYSAAFCATCGDAEILLRPAVFWQGEVASPPRGKFTDTSRLPWDPQAALYTLDYTHTCIGGHFPFTYLRSDWPCAFGAIVTHLCEGDNLSPVSYEESCPVKALGAGGCGLLRSLGQS